MRKLKRTHGMIFAVVAASLSLGCLGFATYAIETNALDKSLAIQNTTERAVCYVNNSEGTTTGKYTTIEKGLANASSGDTVYVYPGLTDGNDDLYKINITEDCEIKSGVTLSLPYEGTTTLEKSQITEEFADRDSANVKKNRSTQVVINDGIKLINNGSLIVGGELGIGKSNQRPTGHTAGKYSEILLRPNATIENNSNIELYGYIKESASDNGSKIIHGSASTSTLPLVFYDFRGGTYSANAYFSNVFPLNSFDMPNCSSTQIYEFGSKLTGLVTAYASSKINESSCILLSSGDDGLFSMSSGSISIKYCPIDCLYTSNDVNKSTTYETMNYTKVVSNGDVKLNKTSFSLAGYTLDTSSFFCPIPQKFRIICESGKMTINNKMKFLSGSSLQICEGAELSIEAETIFYQGYVPQLTIGASDLYPSLGPAKLSVSGKIDISSGGFGGIIDVENESATMTMSDAASYKVDSAEKLDNSNTETHEEIGKTYYGKDQKSDVPYIVLRGDYTSGGDYWIADRLDEISEISINPSSGSKSTAATYEIKASFYPDYTNCTDLTFSWSCDQGDSYLSSTTGDTVTLSVPEATSNDTDYVVTCTLSYKNSNGDLITLDKKATGTFTATYSCFTGDTKITMSDMTTKLAKDVNCGDFVATFDHDSGKLSYSRVAYIFYKPKHETDMLTVNFADGSNLKIVGDGHSLFDVDENRYVELDMTNIELFLGHHFYRLNANGAKSVVELISYNIEHTIEAAYSILTAKDINCFANGLLNVSDNIQGLYNYFDLDKNMKIDKAKKESDIKKYGLSKYEEWSDYCLKEEFEAFNGQYLNVSIGKGLTTKERLQKMMLMYSGKSAS